MKERVISLGILVFALVYMAGAIVLKVGSVEEPGPGFVPAAVAFVLLLVATYNTYKTFRSGSEEKGDKWLQLGPVGIGITIVLYPVILRPLNFLIATFVVLFALLGIMRFKTWKVQVLTALLTTVLSFVIFSKLLGVVLPSGFLEEFFLGL